MALFGVYCTILGLGFWGCDSQMVTSEDQDSSPIPDSTRVVLRPECENARGLGNIATLNTDQPFLIAAPHGTFDLYTAEIADSVCQLLNWNCVVARGYVVDGVRINVNRPSEGANLSPSNEVRSERAACVYEYFVHEAQTVLNEVQTRMYVEIHGASSIQDVEIATVGLSADQAVRIRAILQSAWNALGGSSRTIKMEPIDIISLGATASKESGMLSRFQPALHIELPRGMRQDERDKVVQFLQNGLLTIARNEFLLP